MIECLPSVPENPCSNDNNKDNDDENALKKSKRFVFLLKVIFKHFLSVCVCLCAICAHECSSLRGQKRASDIPELEFQVVVNRPKWVLGIEFGFSGRARTIFSY